jgi:L,D-transpeptidase-like protein
MKSTIQLLTRSMLLLLVLTAPAILVEGKKELLNSNDGNASPSSSQITIRRFMTFSVSATAVCVRTAEAVSAERQAALKAEFQLFVIEAAYIYEDMDLAASGLSRKAFEYAWVGYHKLQKKGMIHKSGILSICDFSQSSSQERMYVIDVRNRKLLFRTFVAHGINSGEQFASSFSNSPESCKSSLGFYVTRKTYTGVNGLSLRIDGVDKGFNDMACQRNIVIHGAPYVSRRILEKYGVMGTTFGCPAIPTEMTGQIIPLVKNGSCFFIYYPSKKYLAQSSVLNG